MDAFEKVKGMLAFYIVHPEYRPRVVRSAGPRPANKGKA
jgi:hypothetical protein